MHFSLRRLIHLLCFAALVKGSQHHESNKLGATASESAVCSRIGVDLIKNGGNAADAVCEMIENRYERNLLVVPFSSSLELYFV